LTLHASFTDGNQAAANRVTAAYLNALSARFDTIASITDTAYGAVAGTNSTTAVTAALAALSSAGGGTLLIPLGTFLITSTLAIPSNVVLQGRGAGSILQFQVSSAAAFSTTSKSNIVLRNLKIDSEGTYSSVVTFDTCTNIRIEDVVYDGQSSASELGTTAFRFYGCTNVTLNGCEIYDVDSGVYLDFNTAGAGATACDDISVLNTHFEQTVLGSSNNPTGVYQFNCKRLLVDGCTFKGIRAGGSSPLAGYSVYEGDGVATSLVVTNCLTIMSTSHPHVMVQNSNAPNCIVKGNRFYAIGPAYPAATYFNWLYQGTCPLGSVNISDNFADQAGIWAQGAATTATATRSVIIHHNQLQNLTQSLGGAIRIGNIGTTYVYYAEVTHNSIYKSYSASIDLSQVARAVVDDNYCANWNTGNNLTNTPPYSMAIYWEGVGANSSVGFCRRNRLENNTQVGADTGYPVDGIVVQNATNLVRLSGNDISSAVTNAYLRATPDSGTYTPTLTNTLNLDASTPQVCQYIRTDNTVTVSGGASIDPTAAGPTAILLGISLPFASNFASSIQAGGTGTSTATENETFAIYADATNDRVVLDGSARSAANHTVWFLFTYTVI
jgi:hypothetical protein